MQAIKLNDSSLVIPEDTFLNNQADGNSCTTLADEQGKILVGVFGKLTSVVFDVSSICELL